MYKCIHIYMFIYMYTINTPARIWLFALTMEPFLVTTSVTGNPSIVAPTYFVYWSVPLVPASVGNMRCQFACAHLPCYFTIV